MASSINFAKEEEVVLKRWEEINAFHRQLELSEGRPRYTFYDGPPFATGKMHYGHILSSTIKDIIPRYWSMKGYHVERRFGWDTHGVPIEHEIDKKFGLSGREAVMKLGLANYNAECRSIVMMYAEEWRKTVTRIGRWVDFDNDYKTMNLTFMESEWWVFKQLWDKGQVYSGYRVMPYSTVLNTALSNFEAKQNYGDITDPAVVVSFPLVSDPNTHLLAWTTTPWTLPSNLALAAHPDFEYVKILDEKSGKHYVLLEKLVGAVYKDPKKAKYKVVEKIKGSAMLGWKYRPMFDYFYDEYKDVAFRVLNATYVLDDSGVGIVHQAPAFGEDDFNVCLAAGVFSEAEAPPDPVDANGFFKPVVSDFAGIHIKEAERLIIKHIKGLDRLVTESQYSHQLPLCPRSDKPLIYKAVMSWFIRIPEITRKMLENIEGTQWVPKAVKEGRFANWIADARDWNVSRNRYWGTPIPIWASEDKQEFVCVGSVAELKELSGYEGDLTDIHRDKIDHITIPSKQGRGVLRRIEEIFDCWFESGSMPYGSKHYPFENVDAFEKSFPADFIAEGLDQTRGWFYTLLVLGTHLFGQSPFKNCVVNGIVLAEDGKKMSKRLKNYPDPGLVIDKYGCDALRMYLINSPVVRAEPLRFKEAGVREVVQKVLLPLWNSYKFFHESAALFKKQARGADWKWNPVIESSNTNVMDKWILASCQSLLKFVNQEMNGYRLYTVMPRLLELLDNTTNWYIRFNRKRLKGEGETPREDTDHALNTLFDILFTLCRGLAPFIPFLTDNIYQRLLRHIPEELREKDPRNIHFLDYPQVREELFDEDIERSVGRMQKIIDLARASREISLKTPLKRLVVIHPSRQYLDDLGGLSSYVKEELNVKELVLTTDEAQYNVQYSVSADWPVLGKKLRQNMKRVKTALPRVTSDEVKAYLSDGHLMVDGIRLEAGDLVVKRDLEADGGSRSLAINTDNDVLTILDNQLYPELVQEGLAREIISRVQKLRKTAGLNTTDDVEMEYRLLADPDNVGLGAAVDSHADLFTRSLRRPLVPGGTVDETKLIIEEEQEIQKATFTLRLLKLS